MEIEDFHEQWLLRNPHVLAPIDGNPDTVENAMQQLHTSLNGLTPTQQRKAIPRVHALAQNPVPEPLDPAPVSPRGRPRGSRNLASSSTLVSHLNSSMSIEGSATVESANSQATMLEIAEGLWMNPNW